MTKFLHYVYFLRILVSKVSVFCPGRLSHLLLFTSWNNIMKIRSNPKLNQLSMLSLFDEAGKVVANSPADEWILNAFGLEDEAKSNDNDD